MSRSLRVGFVGIGNMGWPMARNLVAAGFDVRVHDASPGRAARFAAEAGGTAAASLEALGRGADLVVTMLPSGRDVRDVVTGSGGLASTLASGAVLIDMSSSDPLGTRDLGGALAARGVSLVDAPVSGLVARAEAGTLTIMIGADDEAAVEKARPVLEALGERLIRVGSLGCGHAMKALNNVVAAAAFTVTAEALIVGKRFGLDPAVMAEVLNVSTGRNFHTDMTFPQHVLTRRFASGFALGLLAKDVGIAGDLSSALEASTPVIDLVRRLWAEGRDELGPAADNSAIVQRWERANRVVVEPGGAGQDGRGPSGAGHDGRERSGAGQDARGPSGAAQDTRGPSGGEP
ncbi:MAG TPA: NAD(P)-dependent oxidoreductase [Gammaproteobacteria bacterium]|nr:NAD(P)-dependent oxidoreductase [Gammaproteobacteria bacterium]